MATQFPELKYVVERMRVEMMYTRASLRPFQSMANPGEPNDVEERRINSVGNLLSRLTDAIRAADELLEKIK